MSRLIPGLLAIVVCLLCACTHSGTIEFILCPSEVHWRMEAESGLGRRRELLFPLDYEIALVEKRGEAVVDVPVFRARHSMGSPLPLPASRLASTHVSDDLIARPSGDSLGVAIRREGERAFRVQWLAQEELAAARRAGVVHLRPLEDLPELAAR